MRVLLLFTKPSGLTWSEKPQIKTKNSGAVFPENPEHFNGRNMINLYILNGPEIGRAFELKEGVIVSGDGPLRTIFASMTRPCPASISKSSLEKTDTLSRTS
jgi:hypothetical protein